MADVWTNPSTVATNDTSSAAEWNTYVRDNPTALQLGLNGDGSTDADTIHRHKTGAAGSAPPAVGNAGRIYLPDGQIIAENNAGTARYGFGPGPYDDFFNDSRVGTSTITPSTSGHTWAEASGDFEITASGQLRVTAGTGYATLETGCLLNRLHHISATLNFSTGTNDIGIITKYVDTDNFLFVTLTKTGLNLFSRIAGVETNRSPKTVSFADTDTFLMKVVSAGELFGVEVTRMNSTSVPTECNFSRHADFAHANLAAATKVGLWSHLAVAGCSSLWVDF